MDSVFHHLLLLLLLACLLFSTAPAASWEGNSIYDSDGNPVLAGVRYYVTAPLLPGDCALGMRSSNDSCPLDVYLKKHRYGPPVMLFQNKPREYNNILVDEGVSIMFAEPSHCTDSTQWKLNTRRRLVTTGGAKENSEVNFNQFWVVRHEILGQNLYEFWSCPGGLMCTKLGLIGDDQLLGDSTTPLVVNFIKVPEKLVGSASMRSTA